MKAPYCCSCGNTDDLRIRHDLTLCLHCRLKYNTEYTPLYMKYSHHLMEDLRKAVNKLNTLVETEEK